MANILEQTNKEEKRKMQKPISFKRLIAIIVVLLIIFAIYLLIKYSDDQKKEEVAIPVAKTEQTPAEQAANLKDLRQKLREESSIKTSATNTAIQQTQTIQTQTSSLNPVIQSAKTEPAKPLTQAEMQQQSNTLKALRNKARGVTN